MASSSLATGARWVSTRSSCTPRSSASGSISTDRLGLVWFRRDLRLDDQPALAAALASGRPVACAFVLDPGVFSGEDEASARVQFLLEGLRDLDRRLRERGGGLIVRRGDGADVIAALAHELGAAEVHACADGEPYALARDARAGAACAALGAPLTLHHDQTLVAHDRIRSAEGQPYRTYSAYARAVARVLDDEPVATTTLELRGRLRPTEHAADVPELDELGVTGSIRGTLRGGETAGLAALRAWRDGGGLARYAAQRDDVGQPDATSHLSPYLKLGMLSPRRCAGVARDANARKWAAELLWRDWFKYVLHQHPDLARVSVDPRFERVTWPGDDADFAAWCRGETGFGLVDAGMRQLGETGYQPNRIRMVCASFLCKHLHVDWRRGERWYRSQLIDGDLSSNAGGWQWVAGTGLDAAPYFRVLNPLLQEKRFDVQGRYVARWAPDRPEPILDLARERERALELYRAARTDNDDDRKAAR
ncbi:MAG: deoxyribodipyrimidine photo-lyase [Gaiellales bacterium]